MSGSTTLSELILIKFNFAEYGGFNKIKALDRFHGFI